MLRAVVPSALLVVVACGAPPSPAAPTPLGRAEARAAPDPTGGVDLPLAGRAAPLPTDASPTIVLRGDTVLVDGVAVGDVTDLRAAKRLRRVDGLFDALKRRAARSGGGAGDAEPGRAYLYFGAAEPAFVVKSVLQTAAFAGYPRSVLVVRREDGTLGTLDAQAQMPAPRGAPAPGHFTASEVPAMVRANADRLAACAAKLGQPGNFKVRFLVVTSGQARDAKVTEATPRDAAVETCITKVFETFTFSPTDGEPVEIVFPLHFDARR